MKGSLLFVISNIRHKSEPESDKEGSLSIGSAHDMRKFDTSVRSAGDTAYKLGGVIRLWVNLDAPITPVLFGVARTL